VFAERVAGAELDTVIAYELCYVRGRNNLAALFYMGVQCVFWCYPLVWLIGSRVMLKGELACDEAVLAAGKRTEDLAEAILGVCKLRHEACSPWIAEVAGADLTRRVDMVTGNHVADASMARRLPRLRSSTNCSPRNPICDSRIARDGSRSEILGGAGHHPAHRLITDFSGQYTLDGLPCPNALAFALVRIAVGVAVAQASRFFDSHQL
jgi:hypothetical protein